MSEKVGTFYFPYKFLSSHVKHIKIKFDIIFKISFTFQINCFKTTFK